MFQSGKKRPMVRTVEKSPLPPPASPVANPYAYYYQMQFPALGVTMIPQQAPGVGYFPQQMSFQQQPAALLQTPQVQPPNPAPTTLLQTPQAAPPPVQVTPPMPGSMYKSVPVPKEVLFSQPSKPVPPKQPPKKPAGGVSEWPQSVKEYVRRCFDAAGSSTDRQDKMGQQLKLIIAEASDSGEMWTRHWESMPIPYIPEETKRPTKSKKRQKLETLDAIGRKAKKRRVDGKRERRKFTTKPLILSPAGELDTSSWEPVAGTCQNLEKPFLRLTAPPRPETVRPVPVLKRSLMMVTRKWMEGCDHLYVWGQLKSIRQDLLVQRVRTVFATQVYECHARISLQAGDLSEFNQCQTQLISLYRDGLNGSNREFTGYRILYSVYSGLLNDLISILANLSPQDNEENCIAHALAVREAVSFGDYAQFFKLYASCPHFGRHIMEAMFPQIRRTALLSIITAFRPAVTLAFLAKRLGFESLELAFVKLVEIGAVFEGVTSDLADILRQEEPEQQQQKTMSVESAVKAFTRFLKSSCAGENADGLVEAPLMKEVFHSDTVPLPDLSLRVNPQPSKEIALPPGVTGETKLCWKKSGEAIRGKQQQQDGSSDMAVGFKF